MPAAEESGTAATAAEAGTMTPAVTAAEAASIARQRPRPLGVRLLRIMDVLLIDTEGIF
jgi:hypothetical protein